MTAAGITDNGRVRSQNQDAVFCSVQSVGPLPNLFIVADGMGGHNSGDVASQMAVKLFHRHITGLSKFLYPDEVSGYMDSLVDAAVFANEQIYERSLSQNEFSGMGTTFSCCVIDRGKCDILHIGDSRVYMIANGKIIQLTTDHSYVNELIRAGQLTPREALKHPKRNVLTRVMGVSSTLEADGYPCGIEDGCAVLLCSDGLTNMLDDNAILEIADRDGSPGERAQALVDEANARGGIDNISVVLIDTKN